MLKIITDENILSSFYDLWACSVLNVKLYAIRSSQYIIILKRMYSNKL